MSQPKPHLPDRDLVDRLLGDALCLPSSEREHFITAACGLDESLRSEVLKLSRAYDRLGDFGLAEEHARTPLIGQCSAGEVIAGRFEILELLGAGGMGEVYLAFDRTVMDKVALKFIREEYAADLDMRARLRREVRTRAVAHPNICPIFDLYVEEHNGRTLAFFAMAYLDGVTLAETFRTTGPLPLAQVSQIFKGIAAGLDAAHRVGIIHRDLKPSNIVLVGEPGSMPRPVITDFGLAQVQSKVPDGTQSHADLIIGSPPYMAPEQFVDTNVTRAADIYALGLIAFEMIAGHRPFPDESLVKAAVRRQRETAPELRGICPQVPESWSNAIAASLSVSPEARPVSAERLAEALVLQPAPVKLWLSLRSIPTHVRKKKWVFLAIFAILVALFGTRSRLLKRDAATMPIVVVVSPVVNNTGDRSLDNITSLLTEDLAQSPSISVTSAASMQEVAARMRKKIVTPRDWREASAREGAALLTFGSISEVGGQLVFNGRGETPSSPWWNSSGGNFSEVCESKSSLVSCVHHVTEKLREMAGETPVQINSQNRSLEDVTTRSWEAWALFCEGEAEAQAMHRLQSIALYRAALLHDPQFALAKARLGDELFTIRRQAEGLTYWREAIADADNQRLSRIEELRIRTNYALEIGDDASAEGWLESWRKEFTHDPMALFHLASIYRRSGRYQAALQAAQEMERMHGEPRLAWDSIAITSLFLKNYAVTRNAVSELQKAGQKDQADFDDGALSATQGNFDEAERIFGRLSRSSDSAYAALGNTALSSVIAERGDVRRASAVTEEGIAADQRAGEVGLAAVKLTRRAYLELQLGNRKLASALAHQAISVEPGADTLLNAITIMARAGDVNAAKSALASFDPGLVGPRYEVMRLKLRGEIALATRRYDQAIALLERARRLEPAASPHENLANAYLLKGDQEAAKILINDMEQQPALIWTYPAGTWPGVLRSLKTRLNKTIN